MNRRLTTSMALLATALLTAAPQVWAAGPKDRQEAAQLTAEARTLAKNGALKNAVKNLRRADQLAPQVALKLEIAKHLSDLGDFVQSAVVLREAVATQATQHQDRRAQAEAKKRLEELERRIPTLAIDIATPDASKVTLSVDDEEVDAGQPHPVNPGKREIVAKAEGYRIWAQSVRMNEGETKSIEIRMKRADGSDDGGKRGVTVPKWAAWTTWGLTAVSLGVGVGFGIMAIQTTNQVLRDYNCLDGVCPGPPLYPGKTENAAADLKTAKLNGNVSTAFFVIAGLGAGTGVVVTYFAYRKRPKDGDDNAKSKETRIAAQPLIGPGYLGLRASF